MGKKAKLVLRAAIRNRGLVYLWSPDQNNYVFVLPCRKLNDVWTEAWYSRPIAN